MKNFRDYISVNKETLGGQPVFKGTRVPIETLFNHLERGISLDEFLTDFPTVSHAQAIAVRHSLPLTKTSNINKTFLSIRSRLLF